MRIPLGAERLFVTDEARRRWLLATDSQLRPWPTAPPLNTRPLLALGSIHGRAAIGQPRNPDGSINYAYLDAGEWWNAPAGIMGAGWVRNERFGVGVVIPGVRRKAPK